MSLDIRAYRNIWQVPENEVNCDLNGDVDYSNVQIVVNKEILDWQNNEFPHRADELKGGEYFANNWKTDSIVISRSYGYYNRWRDELYKMSVDFYDLWDFPDNEGYIGRNQSEKLYQVFQKHYEAGMKMVDSELYEFFYKAFDFGRQNGLIVLS